jgi:hypothetical protein
LELFAARLLLPPPPPAQAGRPSANGHRRQLL